MEVCRDVVLELRLNMTQGNTNVGWRFGNYANGTNTQSLAVRNTQEDLCIHNCELSSGGWNTNKVILVYTGL